MEIHRAGFLQNIYRLNKKYHWKKKSYICGQPVVPRLKGLTAVETKQMDAHAAFQPDTLLLVEMKWKWKGVIKKLQPAHCVRPDSSHLQELSACAPNLNVCSFLSNSAREPAHYYRPGNASMTPKWTLAISKPRHLTACEGFFAPALHTSPQALSVMLFIVLCKILFLVFSAVSKLLISAFQTFHRSACSRHTSHSHAASIGAFYYMFILHTTLTPWL